LRSNFVVSRLDETENHAQQSGKCRFSNYAILMANHSDLLPHIDRMRSARVLCIGDVMLDHYVYGDVTRVSPEAPIPVLCVEREMKSLGGAGNVLHNLRALGVAASFVSVVGNDEAGRGWAAAGGAEWC
jgi:hypothetical protein